MPSMHIIPAGMVIPCFFPMTSAFEKFFEKSPDYNNINDILDDEDYARILGRYHILNSEIRTNDFPFGALPDTTLSGDILTVGFVSGLDSTLYLINNLSPVILRNIQASNGYIHVLDELLEPVVLSSFELLKCQP
jgi:uncharacterized surface protein with fasciclin (FAS1) repeats